MSVAEAGPIDLRSDTVTRPTAAMRAAMAAAIVGDDVYGDDPTVNELQELVAREIGFDAALWLPTGTMANLVALAAHTQRGDTVVLPAASHIQDHEVGAASTLLGLVLRPVTTVDGAPDLEAVRREVRRDAQQARVGLLVLENTHNQSGGRVVPLDHARRLQEIAREHGVATHLDGARGFNAAVRLGCHVRDVCAGFDSAVLCLSKGLAAPAGSVLLGTHAYVTRARRLRRMFGGGMRQVGVLAAAGRVAFTDMGARLGDDHRRARRLARALATVPGVVCDAAQVESNIVMAGVADPRALVDALARRGVLATAFTGDAVRFVTHLDVSDADVERAANAVRRCVAEAKPMTGEGGDR